MSLLWKNNKQKGKSLERFFHNNNNNNNNNNKSIFIVVLLIIVAASISFILLYRYSNSISGEIVNLAIDDIRSNAKIQSHVISHSLANSVSAVISNLQVLANAPSIQNGSLSSQTLLDAAQRSTKGLTEGYYWLDKEGIIGLIKMEK